MNFKFLIPISFSILIGFLFGQVIFSNYEKSNISVNTFNEGEKVYFIQIASSSSKDDLTNITSYENYLCLLENNTYYLYGGITKSKEISNIISDAYKNKKFNTKIVTKYINNNTFINILTEYDKVVKISSNSDDLFTIERIVLSNYKEVVLQNESNN